ncbi:hypothetical protein FPHYL_3020 [Fusarium phyllophilum]|uniref:Uncharacterized protein n=1 Tax=Fusarium phyllophilum TaxID=47803 RepID=A0A8H5K5Y6_9HYPO|nr:hypothetical protein FPHYL_3020 [Fusarium phyllophilum]
MESEHNSSPSIWRKPINTVDAVARPTTVESRSVEPASEPLLLDQENNTNTTTKAFDQKQSASAVGVVPINDQIHRSTSNQEDFAVGEYRTEKVSPCAETIVPSRFKQPRPLKDFEAFDKASRGLGGSLSLLTHTKGWFIGIIAAFLLSTTIATSTITQFAVTYPSRFNQEGTKGSAEAWRIEESWGKDEPNYALKFRTLAIGYEVTNVTHLVEADVNFHDGNPNITLPNGVHTEPGKSRARFTGAPTFFLSSGPTLVHRHLQNSSILDYFAIYWDASNRIPWAVEVSYHWCVDTYHPELVDNILQINKSASQIPKLQALQGDDYRGYVPLEIPGKDDITWTIGGRSTRSIATQLNDSLSGYTVVLGGEPIRGTSCSDILAQATREVLQMLAKGNSTLEAQEAERAWWIAVEGIAANVANSLTNTLLPDQSNVDGISLDTEEYIQVQWEWLALLSVQVALSISLLICIIVQSAKAEVEIMKGSTVPVLFAISAVDKARMENGDIDLDSLRQMKNHQQLAHVNLHKLNAEQAQVLDIICGFHKYFSSPPPFKEGQHFTLLRGLITVPFPPEIGGLKTERFNDMYKRVGGLLAKQQESSFKHQLAEQSAESASMDSRGKFIHTVHLCTLHRQILSDRNPWRISALVDMVHLAPEQLVPSVKTGPVSEIIAPFQDFLKSIKAQDWEAIPGLLLPGAGATISKDSQAPETLM